MSGHEIDGRVVLSLGTWEIRDGSRVLGRVNALDAERAIRRGAKRWKVAPGRLTAEAMLLTVFVRDESNGCPIEDE